MRLKWFRPDDTFILTREELAELVEFNVAWKFVKEEERPTGYDEFHKERLIPAHKLLMKYVEVD